MIHIVLPAYNEEENIAPLMREIAYAMDAALPHVVADVVVVDDGSSDNTRQATEQCRDDLASTSSNRITVTLLEHGVNKGLAEAIKTGLAHCAKVAGSRDIILTMDSDNSHTPGLIPSLVRLIHEGHDVVIASRYQKGARVIGLSKYRTFLSLGASMLMRCLFPIHNVRDYTCGYRAYRSSLIKQVMEENPQFISERGFSVNVDILLKLRAIRPEVMMAEAPLLLRYDWKQGGSKMNVSQTIADTLKLVVRRRLGLK